MAAPMNGTQDPPKPEEEKPKRGKPKDPLAPKRPPGPYQKFATEEKARLKETNPELAANMGECGKAIAEAWKNVPDATKEKMTEEYEKLKAIWLPLHKAYIKTPGYKVFYELRQDWIDRRKRKKLGKKMNKDAPKRAKSGYMMFASEVREECVAKCNGDLGAVGKMIAHRWHNEVTEAYKAKLAEKSEQDKIVWQREYAEYVKTQAYADFCTSKAKMEGTQTLKKLIRTHMDEAPKRPLSAYATYREEVMPGVLEQHPQWAKDPRSFGKEMTKHLKGMWEQIGEEKQKTYIDANEKAKEQWKKDFDEFKCKLKYTEFLRKRESTKSRENKQVHLRTMPKRPRSAFALFATDKKSEVPPGKGEGKGQHALKRKWADTSTEDQREYYSKRQELEEQYNKEDAAFKESDSFKTFCKLKTRIEQEYKTEAMKVMTLRFLRAAPAPPPRNGFAIYVKEQTKPGEAKGNRSQQQEKLKEHQKAWAALGKNVKDEYDQKRQEEAKAYDVQVQEYMATPKWKEYVSEAKRLKIPVKVLLLKKKKAIKKIKRGLKTITIIPLPDKPDNMPKKPPSAFSMFSKENKSKVQSVTEIEPMWKNLEPEKRKEYEDRFKSEMAEYTDLLKQFHASDEGQKYNRELNATVRRRKTTRAKEEYLTDYPKKPSGPYSFFCLDTRKEVSKAQPELSRSGVTAKLASNWATMSSEAKEPWTQKAKDALAEYNKAVEEFKQSDNWKKYQKAIIIRKPAGKKGAAKPSTPLPKKPDSCPERPLNAFRLFGKEAGGNLAETAKKWQELGKEGQAKYNERAALASKEHAEAMIAWEKSPEARKWRAQTAAVIKRKRLNDAKNRFLKDEPKRGQSAYFLFVAGMRDEIARTTDLKGFAITGECAKRWSALDAEGKQPWVDKFKEEEKEYLEKMEEFKKTMDYKKYEQAVRRANPAPKKGTAKAKASGPKKPEMPLNYPKRPPPSALMLFMMGMKEQGKGGNLAECHKAWREMGAEGQKPWHQKMADANKEYASATAAFQNTAEGKKYDREMRAWREKSKVVTAKKRFLNAEDAPKEPKKPPGAFFVFAQENRAKLTEENPNLSMAEQAKKLNDMWTNATPEEKQEIAQKCKEAQDQYEEELKAYKNHPSVRKYQKAIGGIESARKAKVKTAPKPKATRAPKAKGAPKAKAAAADDSDSDVMGSDSSSSSSSDSDSD